MKKYKFNPPLSHKVYSIVLVSVAFSAIFIGIYYYFESKRILRENIGTGLKNIAQTAALGIDYEELANITSIKDPSYKKTRDYLLEVKKKNEIASPIYLLRRKDFNYASLLLTTEPSFMLGAKYKLNPSMKKVFTTGESVYSPLYTDKSGTWISAYAPIINKDGFMVGVIELNHEIGYYIKQLRSILLRIILLCVIGCLIGILLGIRLLTPILNSINTLHKAATEIEKGNYEHKIALHTQDEMGYLAYAFDKMRVSIKRYIRQLEKAWIEERKAHLESVKTLSEAIAIREPYTKGHIERVSKCAELIAKEMHISDEEIATIKYGCLLHDVGKIGINIDIINKPSKLTASEFEEIKKHPELGAQIIKGIKFLEKAKDMILYHQEHYDGTGYPSGLKGENIPLSARIVALADAYDAMASDRPYRKKFDNEEIISSIKKQSGKQFDPKVVEAFLKIYHRI